MIATTILGLLAVPLAYLGRYKNARWALKASFGLIFVFLAFRYNFGNDYGVYLQTFLDIRDCPTPGAFDNPLQFEIGWVYVNWWFRYLGFFAMIAVLALLNCIVYYRLLRKYAPPKLYWLGVFLYVFTPQFMLINASAMRQSFAIMLFVYSIDYIQKRKPIRFILCVGLASLFHFTVIALLPMYALGSRKWVPSIAMQIGSTATFIVLILFGQVLSPYVRQFVSAYLPRYQVHQDVGSVSTGLGFVYLFAMLVVLLYIEASQGTGGFVMIRLGAVWCMLAPITLVLSLLGRIGMYLSPATLVAFPVTVTSVRRPLDRLLFLPALCVFTIYLYAQFFSSDVWSPYYGTYRTIFSAPEWY